METRKSAFESQWQGRNDLARVWFPRLLLGCRRRRRRQKLPAYSFPSFSLFVWQLSANPNRSISFPASSLAGWLFLLLPPLLAESGSLSLCLHRMLKSWLDRQADGLDRRTDRRTERTRNVKERGPKVWTERIKRASETGLLKVGKTEK